MSIPTSVIIMGLVALWLAILVPMFAKRREPVPETDMDTGTFRVLRRASASMRRRPRFSRRDEFDDDYADQDDMLNENDALDDELVDGELVDAELVDGYGNADTDHLEYGEYAEYVETEYAEVEYAEVVDREPVKAPRRGLRAWARREPETVEYAETSDYAESVEYADAAENFETADHYTGVAQYSGAEEYTSAAQYEDAVDETYATASYTSYDDDHRRDVPRRSGRRDPLEDVDEAQLRPVPRRPGRGGYDPDAAEAARAYRYSRRRRVTVILLLVTLAFSAAAYFLNPMLWTGTAVFGLLLVAFLTYLRRQVRIENDITARRLARLRRARQIRPEYHLDREEAPVTGSAFGRGAVAVSQVPPSGYRRGREIVDLEDDDPSFDDLDYYQPALYRRASGQ